MSGERSLSTPSASLVHPVSGGQFESGAVSGDKFNRTRIARIWVMNGERWAVSVELKYFVANRSTFNVNQIRSSANRSPAHRLISLTV